MTEPKRLSMKDVGKRLDHLNELHNIWSFALGQLTDMNARDGNVFRENQAKELQIALDLLTFHMQNDYSPTTYAQVINNLPKDANDIRDASDAT